MGEDPNDARPEHAPPKLDLNKPGPGDEPPADRPPADRPPAGSGETVMIRPARGGAPRDATPADAVPADATPRDAVPGEAAPADAPPRDATPADAVPADAAPRDPAPPQATPTGSFRLPAPAPGAGGTAPWEAPPQNGGSTGTAASAAPAGSFGPADPSGASGSGFGPADSSGTAASAAPAGSFGPADPSGTSGSGFGPADSSGTAGSGFGPPSGGFGGGFGAGGPYGHGQAPAAAPGWAGAGTLPPPPSAPPGSGPGGGGGQGESRPLQAVAVGLLNLSCLGLGYVLLRQWIGAAVCWAATAALLLLALPADADGVPLGVLVGYGAVLLAAAADGARRGLRASLSVGAAARRLVLPLAVVLLAVPAGGAVAYGSARDDAREEAFQQSLLARLATADALVKAKEGSRFELAESDYTTALDTYEKLALDHPGSRAAKLVPERLDAYVTSVSKPYTDKKYCDAVDPLKHLRGLPDTVDAKVLGDRADGFDEPLAQSLYECGAGELGRESTAAAHEAFTELAATFPESVYVGRTEKLVGDGLRKAAAPLSDGSASDPCATTEEVRTQRSGVAGLKGYELSGPVADADRAIQKGVFSCGTKQFRDEEYSDAVKTMDQYAKDYPKSPQTAHARTISIAAQIADHEPAAGKKLPSATVPGGSRMPMVVSNDGKDAVELLYTGPVTGKITLRACGTCTNYGGIRGAVDPDAKPCGGASSKYPKATLQLPAGTYHFLQRRAGGGFAVAGETKSSKAEIEPGYTYTNCLYVTSGL
ncbi:hypothetical protein ACFC8F_22265 [Streptomyces hydrogenans]|uniref:hypothetical protein n=1 Tax=Streptomyces hydrogenans TaxID=1873719 RepID=UPI0035DE0F4B